MSQSSSRPQILIDARMVGPHVHGIARYVMHMAEGLAKLNQPLAYDPVFMVQSQMMPRHEDWYGFRLLEVTAPFLSSSELLEIPRILRREKAALYHSPSLSSLLSCPCPHIQTIHDLNHLMFGSITKRLYYQWVMKPFALKAKRLLTVSRFSQKELSLWLKKPEEEIEVIYNAMDLPPSAEEIQAQTEKVLGKFNLQKGRYFFSLSNAKPHKNLQTIVKAYRVFRERHHSDWPLVLTIPERDHGMELAEGVVLTGSLNFLHAQTLLANSAALLFPSLYEGFGRPPVEAALLGVPILVSRIPPHEEGLEEISVGKASFVSPSDLSGWIHGMEQVLKGEIDGTPEMGRERLLARHSVEKMGLRTDEIYRKVLGIKN